MTSPTYVHVLLTSCQDGHGRCQSYQQPHIDISTSQLPLTHIERKKQKTPKMAKKTAVPISTNSQSVAIGS